MGHVKGGGAQRHTGQGERLHGTNDGGAVSSDTCMPQGLHLMSRPAVTHGSGRGCDTW